MNEYTLLVVVYQCDGDTMSGLLNVPSRLYQNRANDDELDTFIFTKLSSVLEDQLGELPDTITIEYRESIDTIAAQLSITEQEADHAVLVVGYTNGDIWTKLYPPMSVGEVIKKTKARNDIVEINRINDLTCIN